jgi:glyoxylase-like metal-dependent hydrolase (beta-lactamase superfamily II)
MVFSLRSSVIGPASGAAFVALAALIGGLSAAPAVAQRGPAPDPLIREGVTVKLGPHTYAIPDFSTPMVPNVGIVVGNRATLVVDTGLGKRNGEAILREVAKVSKNTEMYIVTTHFHVEHTMGYTAFPPSAKYVNAKQQEADFDEGGMRQVQTFAGRSPLTTELLAGATRRAADITFDREHVLELGGVRVRLAMVGPTHTKGDTVVFVEGDGVLFAGDVVMNKSFVSANANSSMKAWLAAFDLFTAWKPGQIVPAHGDIGPGSILPTLQAEVLGIQARARELKAQGRTADETATAVQMEFQARQPAWGRANGIAALARSAYAEAP